MKLLSIIPSKLSKVLEKLGKTVATYPRWTIILSIFSSFLLSLGIIRLEILTDLTDTYTPVNCRAYKEQIITNQLFPMNMSHEFDVLRLTNKVRGVWVIVTTKNISNVLRKPVFTEIAILDKMISSLEIKWKNNIYTYNDVCAKYNGKCFLNQALYYLEKLSQIESREIDIKYPVEINLRDMSFNITGFSFGGVRTSITNEIIDVKAIRLMYYLDNSNEEINEISSMWEKEFKNQILNYTSEIIVINIFLFSDYEIVGWKYIFEGLQYGGLSFAVIVAFCVASSMTSDWVTSKPYLSIAGCLSAGLSFLASTGMVAAVGVPFTSSNLIILFLLIGIGVDDMFLLISTWRTTDRKDSVIKRLTDTYFHVAMSILITSLSNIVAFVVGATLPIPAIRFFCIHGAVAMIFDLIYQLTFFGGCMALDGYREEDKLHSLTLQPIAIAQKTGYRSRIYQIFFMNNSEVTESKHPFLMKWCHDKLGYWISKKKVSTLIVIIAIVYLLGASWGYTSLKYGLEVQTTFPQNSQPYLALLNINRYFTKYTYPIQVIINKTLDYSNPRIQRKVLRNVARFHRSKYIHNIEINWLKHYLFLSRYNKTYSSYNLSEPEGFANCLRNEFFSHPLGRMYRNDIRFGENGVQITSSRFILISNISLNVKEHMEFITEMRSIADSMPFAATVQSYWWFMYEISLITNNLSIQAIGATVSSIFLVFVLLSSRLESAIIVAVTILSIEFGMIGYLSVLGITLNPISLIVLILSIGFSIDSSTHVCYAYGKSRGTYRERIQQTLYAAGVPVFQGCMSTVLGILPLALVKIYVYRVSVILISLLIIISFLHAIFILPILLGFWNYITQLSSKVESKDGNENNIPSSSAIVSMTNIIDTSHM